MDSIKNVGKKITSWAKKNVVGKGDDYVSTHKEARQIQENMDRYENNIEKIEKDVQSVADMSQLKPPSLSDVSNKELLILGTATGAAIGGGLGMVDEVINVALDNPKVEITEIEHTVQKPQLAEQPYRHVAKDRFDRYNTLEGTQHTFHPNIEYEEVGTWTEKKGEVVHTANVENPIMSGAKGMALGAGVGAAGALAVAVGRKVLNKGKYVPREDREIEGQAKVVAAGAGIGAAGGAALGGISAMMEKGNTVAEEVKFKQPVMEQTNLGKIPQDTYVTAYDVYRESSLPRRDVTVEAPKMEDPLIGGERPAMEKVTETVAAEPRFGVMGQILGGAVLGSIGGALIGVVVNTLRKII